MLMSHPDEPRERRGCREVWGQKQLCRLGLCTRLITLAPPSALLAAAAAASFETQEAGLAHRLVRAAVACRRSAVRVDQHVQRHSLPAVRVPSIIIQLETLLQVHRAYCEMALRHRSRTSSRQIEQQQDQEQHQDLSSCSPSFCQQSEHM